MRVLSERAVHALAAIHTMAERSVEENAPGRVAASTIARAIGLPPRGLEAVMQDLARAGFVAGHRGPAGGYELAADVLDRTMVELVVAIDGEPDRTAPDCISGAALYVVDAVLDRLAWIPIHEACAAARIAVRKGAAA